MHYFTTIGMPSPFMALSLALLVLFCSSANCATTRTGKEEISAAATTMAENPPPTPPTSPGGAGNDGCNCATSSPMYPVLKSLCGAGDAIKKHVGAARFAVLLASACLLIDQCDAGPAAYGICQAGCAAVVVACYAGAGAVFGTVTAGVGVAPALIACNTAFGTCQAACAAALVMPTP